MDVEAWLDDMAVRGYVWYLKRLSANDTQLTGGHQAGLYVPKDVMFLLFPTLNRPAEHNPDLRFALTIDSDSSTPQARARAVWYNNALHGNRTRGRNEVRITRLGGGASPLLDVENTGALAVFAFQRPAEQGSARSCRVWICGCDEEDAVESRWGPVEPGQWRLIDFNNATQFRRSDATCWLQPDDFPASWLESYPPAEEIIRKAVALRPVTEGCADKRLIERRECEFEVFQSLEEAVELPGIREGFDDLTSFIQRANTILQRRKARSGLSLELHVKTILEEEHFQEDLHFSYQAESEPGKRPDFLFPNAKAYGRCSIPPRSVEDVSCEDHVQRPLAPDSQRGRQGPCQALAYSAGRCFANSVSGDEKRRCSARSASVGAWSVSERRQERNPRPCHVHSRGETALARSDFHHS